MAEAVPGGVRPTMQNPYGDPPLPSPPQPGGLAPDYKRSRPQMPDLSVHGRRGLRQFSGFVFEEWLSELQGDRGRRVFKEIRDQDSVVGGVLLAFEMFIRQVNWRVIPSGPSAQAKADAVFVTQAHSDMEEAWPDTLSEILSMFTYGWSLFEMIYKIRGGDDRRPEYKSQFNDGKIGWRRWSIRSQDTLLRWEIDQDSDEILGMWQMPPPTYQLRYVPMAKSLLFRTSVLHGNPEGRSLLRNVYEPNYFLKHMKRIEAIGVERDLAGFPIMEVPGEMLSEDAPESDKARLAQYQEMVRGIKRDEQEGAIIPSDVDPESRTKLYDIRLLSTGGRRQFPTAEIITRYKVEEAMALLSDIIMLGHENSGTYALGESKRGMMVMAISAFLDIIAGVVNRFAIPELMRLNGRPYASDQTPNLIHGDVDKADLSALGGYLTALQNAGMLPQTPELQNYLLEQGNMPTPQPILDPTGPAAVPEARTVPPSTSGSPPSYDPAQTLRSHPQSRVNEPLTPAKSGA